MSITWLDGDRTLTDCPVCSQVGRVERLENFVDVVCSSGCGADAVAQAIEPLRPQIVAEMDDRTARQAAQAAEVSAAVDPATPDAASATALKAGSSVYPLLDVARIAQLPPPAWLVDGMIPASALAVLYGPSNAGKSFLALDFAMCVASALPWWGRQTKQGAVVYIAAEGVGGLANRNAAWQAERAPALEASESNALADLRFLPEAPNLYRGDVDQVRRTLAKVDDLALIVVDTMARCMIGGDENSARDVGVFVNAIDTIRADHGATALVVHHTGKDGENERGSSALRGAADAMLRLAPDGASLRLECDKAKDAAMFDPWALHLAEVAESCVIRVGSDDDRLSSQEERILRSLPESFGSSPAATAKLLAASGLPERTFYRAVQSLSQRGFLDCKPQGRSKLYSVTEAGHREIAANDCQTTANDGDYCQAVEGSPPVGGSPHWQQSLAPDSEAGSARATSPGSTAHTTTDRVPQNCTSARQALDDPPEMPTMYDPETGA